FPMKSKSKVAISFGVGLAVSAAAMYAALRNVPFGELLESFASFKVIWILPAVVVILAGFGLRAVRWGIILRNSCSLGFWQLFHPMMIGFMLNSILPGRVGELARPAILRQKEKIPFATGLATILAERVFDICFLLLFLAITLSAVHIDPQYNVGVGGYHLTGETLVGIGFGMVQLAVVLLFGVVLVSFGKTRRLIASLIFFFPRLLAWLPAVERFTEQRLCRPLVRFMENVAEGLQLVKDPKRLGLCLLLSLVIWLLFGLSYFLLAQASAGVDGLSFLQILAMMIIVMIFIALPSAPGFWGVWEAGGVFALSLFGINSQQASGYTLISHAVQTLPVIAVGFVSAYAAGINIRRLRQEEEVIDALEQTEGEKRD
ncbi:MAG: lysylphosphatidylglycerol synthase transmembrane domain-containing protein, partial [Deltaproteobacteria bacterium]